MAYCKVETADGKPEINHNMYGWTLSLLYFSDRIWYNESTEQKKIYCISFFAKQPILIVVLVRRRAIWVHIRL